jgi:predicted RNA polymerase sigma factor
MSLPLMEEAEHHLVEAFNQRRIGRFQLEAVIQSVHNERARTNRTDWRPQHYSRSHSLSPREREIVRMVAQGHPDGTSAAGPRVRICDESLQN